jgi:hypothetical protein
MKSCELTGIWSSRWLGEEKHVKITGRIEMYKDKPEIRIMQRLSLSEPIFPFGAQLRLKNRLANRG